MTDKEKLIKIKKLADAMYYAAQNLTTDASRLHKAMEEYHQFIIHEYRKEEPVSIWHDASEKPERDDLLIETNDGRIIHRQSINNYGMVKRWAYTSALLNLDNSCNLGNNSQEEPVSKEFEKTFISFVNATHDNNGSYSLHDFAQRLYNIAKEELEEPVSESNKELAETYLAVFNKKFPILPSLSGKQLADYKNFLNKCQQIFGLKEWGIRSTQAKLFEKLSLLWAAWGVEHLQGVGRQDKKEQDIPVSEDLEEAADVYSKVFSDIAAPYIRKDAFIAGANWQKQQEYTCYEEAFEDGAAWKYEQMLKDAFECEVKVDAGGYPDIPQIELYDYDKDVPLAKEGDRYKVILIKED